MNCLYCHKKIPRLKRLTSSSEFCSDEHQRVHKQEILDRLLEEQAGGERVVEDDPIHRLAALHGQPPDVNSAHRKWERQPFQVIEVRRQVPEMKRSNSGASIHLQAPTIRMGPSLVPIEVPIPVPRGRPQPASGTEQVHGPQAVPLADFDAVPVPAGRAADLAHLESTPQLQPAITPELTTLSVASTASLGHLRAAELASLGVRASSAQATPPPMGAAGELVAIERRISQMPRAAGLSFRSVTAQQSTGKPATSPLGFALPVLQPIFVGGEPVWGIEGLSAGAPRSLRPQIGAASQAVDFLAPPPASAHGYLLHIPTVTSQAAQMAPGHGEVRSAAAAVTPVMAPTPGIQKSLGWRGPGASFHTPAPAPWDDPSIPLERPPVGFHRPDRTVRLPSAPPPTRHFFPTQKASVANAKPVPAMMIQAVSAALHAVEPSPLSVSWSPTPVAPRTPSAVMLPAPEPRPAGRLVQPQPLADIGRQPAQAARSAAPASTAPLQAPHAGKTLATHGLAPRPMGPLSGAQPARDKAASRLAQLPVPSLEPVVPPVAGWSRPELAPQAPACSAQTLARSGLDPRRPALDLSTIETVAEASILSASAPLPTWFSPGGITGATAQVCGPSLSRNWKRTSESTPRLAPLRLDLLVPPEGATKLMAGPGLLGLETAVQIDRRQVRVPRHTVGPKPELPFGTSSTRRVAGASEPPRVVSSENIPSSKLQLPSAPEPRFRPLRPPPTTTLTPPPADSQPERLEEEFSLRAALKKQQRPSRIRQFARWLTIAWHDSLSPALRTRKGKLAVAAPVLVAGLLFGMRNERAPLRVWLHATLQPLAVRSFYSIEDGFQPGSNAWTNASMFLRQPDGLVELQEGLSLFRPSLARADYEFSFSGLIRQGGLGWVVRASDAENYYAFKLAFRGKGKKREAGLVRYAVVNGQASAAEKAAFTVLPIPLEENRMYRLTVQVTGDRVTTLVDDQGVDSYTDPRLTTGGVGFFAEKGDGARVHSLAVSGNPDPTGRFIYWWKGFYLFLERNLFGS